MAPRIEQLDALQALLDVLLQTQPDAPQRARISELQGQLATVRAGIVAMAAAEAGEGAAAAPPVSSPLDVARAFSLVSSPAATAAAAAAPRRTRLPQRARGCR